MSRTEADSGLTLLKSKPDGETSLSRWPVTPGIPCYAKKEAEPMLHAYPFDQNLVTQYDICSFMGTITVSSAKSECSLFSNDS